MREHEAAGGYDCRRRRRRRCAWTGLQRCREKDRRRNRLSHARANKLVGLFHNLRLLKRMKKVSYAEPAVAWTDNLERSSVTKFEPLEAKTSCLVPNLPSSSA